MMISTGLKSLFALALLLSLTVFADGAPDPVVEEEAAKQER